MVVGRPMTLPTFKLSGKELLVADSFKYLGSFFADDGSMSRKMDVRNVRALAAFRHFKASCETWTWTEVQMDTLEVTHSNRLRCITGVKLTDRHGLDCT
eukprot:354542-Chlamydomonas_euryale.AAC.4